MNRHMPRIGRKSAADTNKLRSAGLRHMAGLPEKQEGADGCDKRTNLYSDCDGLVYAGGAGNRTVVRAAQQDPAMIFIWADGSLGLWLLP